MYFDPRLWQLTRGLRGWIALAVLLGLIASVVGIARFAILGVLLSHVFHCAVFLAVAVPALGVAVAVVLRGIVDHHRTMISHRTAARVQEDLRGRLYDKIAALGPSWFAGERTGVVSPPRTPLRPRAPRGAQILRLGVPRRGARPADIEGVRTERVLWPPARRPGARAVRHFVAGNLDRGNDPRHHRLRGGDRRSRGVVARRVAGVARADEHPGIADRADGGDRGV